MREKTKRRDLRRRKQENEQKSEDVKRKTLKTRKKTVKHQMSTERGYGMGKVEEEKCESTENRCETRLNEKMNRKKRLHDHRETTPKKDPK